MDLGLKELLIFGGVALIILVLGDALRRYRRLKRGGLRMDLDLTGSVSGDLFNPELPTGGARHVGAELSQMDASENAAGVAAANQHLNTVELDSTFTQKEKISFETSTQQGHAEVERERVVSFTAARSKSINEMVFGRKPDFQLDDQVDLSKRDEALLSQSQNTLTKQGPITKAASGAHRAHHSVSAGGRRPVSEAVAQPDEILILSIMAPQGRFFEGPKLVQALVSLGLRFGEHGAFHIYEPKALVDKPVISVTNGAKPGVFDLSDIDAIKTNALFAFLPLPGPKDPEATFERFLTLGDGLSKALGARLCDEQRKPLTQAGLEMMYHRLQSVARNHQSANADSEDLAHQKHTQAKVPATEEA